jgi:aspartyl protease family protein
MGFDHRDGMKPGDRQPSAAPPPGYVPTRRPPAGLMWMVLLWCLIGGALYLMVRSFVPGFGPVRVQAAGADELLLSPDRSGNYTVPGAINGVPVTFLVDTGASTVSVSARAADRMGLSGCQGIASQTANGSTSGCLALARELRFGPFTARDVRVAVLPHLSGGTALLGMNLLSRMRMVQQDGHLELRASGRTPGA